MISFYPGPSKIYEEAGMLMQNATREGILSVNHRSQEFIDLSRECIRILKQKLDIPEDYSIFYVSSATECWEIITQSLVTERSFHIFNGAFGKKWYEYSKKLRQGATGYEFGIDEAPSPGLHIPPTAELVCVTHNETSNGTKISSSFIRKLRDEHPEKLIAVDATSSMAGVLLDFGSADIWFASVQKCFGLPAGLGLLICSPSAMGRAISIGENRHYNSLLFLGEMMEKWQTSYTPNVLGIYLLKNIMEKRPGIADTAKETESRAQSWYGFFEQQDKFGLLVSNKAMRSDTVIAVKGSKEQIGHIKSEARKQGLLLGNGYGPWADRTFRIANFPAITETEIEQLKKFITDFGN